MDQLGNLKQDLEKLKSPEKAKLLQGFFKTGKGQYGKGDIFLGVTVPQTRKITKAYSFLDLQSIQKLLTSHFHEERLAALLILIENFKRSSEEKRQEIIGFYLNNTQYINNWDLVDLSAPNIVGNYLLDKPKDILYPLAKSQSLWEKRISIISTLAFIKNNQFDDTFKIAEILLNDTHDLIHKAVGWMLREVGKKNQQAEENFLSIYYKKMPRTMLRYAIEKFHENRRKDYLQGKI